METELTDDPDVTRLFQVVSEITVREDTAGRTRRHDGVPIYWSVDRTADDAPFSPEEVLVKEKRGDKRDENAVACLFTKEEAFHSLEDLEEDRPEGRHRLESVPIPAKPGDFQHNPSRSQWLHETSSDLELVGWAYPNEADRAGWERDGELYRDVTVTLPAEMLERLQTRDLGAYIRELEETAEALRDVPNPRPPGSGVPF